MINEKKIRFGIVGCSSVAKRRFLPALMKSSLATLECIGSRTTEKAKDFQKAIKENLSKNLIFENKEFNKSISSEKRSTSFLYLLNFFTILLTTVYHAL